MVTVLTKELRRQLSVDGVDYTVAVDSEGIRLTGKGKRKPEVQLRWRDLLSGETALAVALNASLLAGKRPAVGKPKTDLLSAPKVEQTHKKGRARSAPKQRPI